MVFPPLDMRVIFACVLGLLAFPLKLVGLPHMSGAWNIPCPALKVAASL